MIILLLLFLPYIAAQNITVTPVPTVTQPTVYLQLRIGIAAAVKTQVDSIGWPICGGAVPLALARLQSNGYLRNFNFKFNTEYTECDLASTVKAGLKFMKDENMDVIIGPPCAQALKVMGTLSKIYRKPLLGWGFVSQSDLSDTTRYPYLATVLPNSQTLGAATSSLLATFEWDRVAMLYYANDLNYCGSVMDDVEAVLNDPLSYPVQIVMKTSIDTVDAAGFANTMQIVKSRARIILWCAQTGREKRDYIVKIANLKMDTSEYVHVMLSMRSIGFGVQTFVGKTVFSQSGLTPIWEAFSTEQDGLEEIAKRGATKMLVLDLNSAVQDVDYLQYLQKNILSAVKAPPMSCNVTECINANSTGMGAYARHLFDVVTLYGLALSKLNTTNPLIYDNVDSIVPNFVTSFQGMTGEVVMNEDYARMPLYELYGLSDKMDQVSLMKLSFLNGTTTVTPSYTNESSAVWHFWGGVRPLDTPICGFSGTSCPVPAWEQFKVLIIVAVALIIFIILNFLICMIYLIRSKRLEQARINAEWQIKFYLLTLPEKKTKKGTSRRSIQSGPSTLTEQSHMTHDSMNVYENYTTYIYEKDPVLTTKFHWKMMTKPDMERFVMLRKMDHENLNKFIGLSIDTSSFIAVWRMCTRGSLQDIISRGAFTMDYFFMYCIIRDIAEGLSYLHHSFIRYHGNLRSATCLVNESWQVKLTDFGLDNLAENTDKPIKKRQLWMAPEVLRHGGGQFEPSSDIYSFSIIASEILTKREAWDLDERKEGYEEILYLIKKGGHHPLRPDLIVDVLDLNPRVVTIVKECWSEAPEDRPSARDLCQSLKDLMPKNKSNLMDHVFSMLEEYTTQLEIEIEDRTKELTLEKKKADILLGRMLPKQVAERLKMGQTVEPEGFDEVTVFFSDVVKFTILATKCSPFQVVNLLNDLYSNFDSIIEAQNAYKVESIGDGYLCVSGLPIRNGHKHIKNIIDMSLDFMDYCKEFKIPHLPREKLELRIGVNSGPCVAGVVGLSMPRYCLFGDTVNTASRMESNGKSSLIHISSASHTLLTSYYPREYETHSRGDVIIKGKGVMETFWVMGRATDSNRSTPPIDSMQSPQRMIASPPRRVSSVTTLIGNELIAARSVSPIVDAVEESESSLMSEPIYRQYRKDTLKV